MPNSTFSIPKPINLNGSSPRSGESMGLILFFGIILFLLSLAAFGGAYFYKQMVAKQITDVTSALEAIKKDFDPALIGQLSMTSGAIESAKSLLLAHRSPSRVFELLEENTIPSVAFSSFSFAAASDSVTLSGEAKSYSALAQELDVLEKNPLIKGVLLSNPSLLSGGTIGFSIKVDLDPNILTYR